MRNVLYTFLSILTFFLAKTLVASLMEVDQDQRLTAQEAIAHEWYKKRKERKWQLTSESHNNNLPPHLSRISGNAASDKNIKDGVCAQIEKNFAKAKWKVQLMDHDAETHLQYLAFNTHLGIKSMI